MIKDEDGYSGQFSKEQRWLCGWRDPNKLLLLKPKKMTEGAQLIAKERQEQIDKHGWDETDVNYVDGELLSAALFALDSGEFYESWPHGWGIHFKNKILNKDRIGQLKVAGAFIAAEIDRLLALPKTINNDNTITGQDSL